MTYTLYHSILREILLDSSNTFVPHAMFLLCSNKYLILLVYKLMYYYVVVR